MSDWQSVVLTAAEEQVFQAFYEKRKGEAGLNPLTPISEEVEFARDILRSIVEDGLVVDQHGGVSWFRRDGIDWSDPAAVEAMQAAVGDSVTGATGPMPAAMGNGGNHKDMLTGIAIMVVIIIGVVWYLVGGRSGEAKGVEGEVPDGEGGEMVAATPLPTLEAELLADIVGSGAKTGLVAPRTLEVAGVSFVVQPVQISSGDWLLPDDERAVSWVFGTVVNYVFGLEATDDNKTLLGRMQPGDEMLLRMSTGPAFRFVYADAVRVQPQASEIFRQTRPGLTLVLMGDNDRADRIVLRAAYVPDSETGSLTGRPARQTTTLGQAITIDERVRVLPLDVYPLAGEGLPGQYITLALDVVLSNLSNLPLRSGMFQHQLAVDGLSFSAFETPLTGQHHAALPATIQPGGVVTATLAYALPEAMLHQSSLWHFILDPISPHPAQVAIPPYSGPYSGQLNPQISLVASTFEGAIISTTVKVAAPLNDLTVTATDLQVLGALVDGAGSSPFPWQVKAGQSFDYRLRLHPQADQVQVLLGSQGFELTVYR